VAGAVEVSVEDSDEEDESWAATRASTEDRVTRESFILTSQKRQTWVSMEKTSKEKLKTEFSRETKRRTWMGRKKRRKRRRKRRGKKRDWGQKAKGNKAPATAESGQVSCYTRQFGLESQSFSPLTETPGGLVVLWRAAISRVSRLLSINLGIPWLGRIQVT
jgi:hypothetical protein